MLDLRECASVLVEEGKGILAIDETAGHADAWLASHGITGGEEMQRQFRQLFFGAPGVEKYITGVIMFEGTLSQKEDGGKTFPVYLREKGIISGVKVDQGVEPFPGSPEESITNGLLGLPERLAEFRKNFGTGFTKWRMVINIDGTRLPTAQALHENSKRLATYALEAQKVAMVPIVEPEVILKGTHSRMRSREVLHDTLHVLMGALEDQAVDMSAVILKTSMALSGSESGKMDTPEEVAKDTVEALLAAVPASIPGIVFLSGGQSTEQATANLAAIVKYANERNAPWPLTFSYARALQDEALTVWAGKAENIAAAQEVFLARLATEQNAILAPI